jgi:hypothetical protein
MSVPCLTGMLGRLVLRAPTGDAECLQDEEREAVKSNTDSDG